VALILGCSIAVWFETVAGEPSSSTALKVVTLTLLEAATDVLKGAAFAMYNINLGHVSYNLTLMTVLAMAAAGGAAGTALFINVRATCLIRGAVAELLGYS
jgi:hypothetical protein